MYNHVGEWSMAGRWWWFVLGISVSMTVLLQATTAEGKSSENCTYVYTKQPAVAALEFDCNPYRPSSLLPLACEVSGPQSPSFSIAWFRDYEKLSQRDGITITNTTNITEGSTVYSKIIFAKEYVESGTNYYCQVVLNGSTVVERSDVLVLEHEESYMNHVGDCKAEAPLYTENGDCANLTLPGMESSSTSPSYLMAITHTPSYAVTSTSRPTTSIPTNLPSSPALSPDQMPDPNPDGGSGSSLQVWLYVVVAVAAVFAMIIIVLTIMCMGMCLRKSQTGDLEAMKQQEQRVSGQHFQTTGSSVLWNGVDQRHLELQGNPTSSTQLTNNSHSVTLPVFSDYNTLGERDYEVIDIPDHKNEYHRLQRPSLPNGRPSQSTSLPNGKFFSRLQSTSSTSSAQHMNGILTRQGNATMVHVPGREDVSSSKGDWRVCKSLDMPEEDRTEFLYSPPSASSPDILRQFDRNDSNTQLLPNSANRPMDTLHSNANESLYSPSNPLFQHALQGVPETGTMFPEPSEPSEFPVHVYESIPGALAGYETPLSSKKTSAPTLPEPVGAGLTLKSTASEADYPDTSTDYTGTGEAVVNFPVTTLSSDYYPKSSTGDSQYSDTLGFTTDFTGASAHILYPTSKSLPDFTDVAEFIVEARGSTLGHTPRSEETDRTDNSDFTGPMPLYHVLEQYNKNSHSRLHPYKKLDPSTMEPALKYTKLHVGKNTPV